MNGTLQKLGDAYVIRFERRLAHPPEKVWRALTENAELRHWFPARIDGERRVGAPLQFVFEGEEAPPSPGELRVFEPPRLLEYTWEGSTLRWELHPAPGGCRLVFTQTVLDRAHAPRDTTGWHLCLDGLETWLGGSEPGPPPEGRFAEVHTRYLAEFGLGAFPGFITGTVAQVPGFEHSPGLELAAFAGERSARMVTAVARQPVAIAEHAHQAEHYILVVSGALTLVTHAGEIRLPSGSEFVVPAGLRIKGEYAAGTRTIHAFAAS